MLLHHIGQLHRAGAGHETEVQLHWLDAERDVPILSEALLQYLPKLRASAGALLKVLSPFFATNLMTLCASTNFDDCTL
jgi:hypothetical protein